MRWEQADVVVWVIGKSLTSCALYSSLGQRRGTQCLTDATWTAHGSRDGNVMWCDGDAT